MKPTSGRCGVVLGIAIGAGVFLPTSLFAVTEARLLSPDQSVQFRVFLHDGHLKFPEPSPRPGAS